MLQEKEEGRELRREKNENVDPAPGGTPEIEGPTPDLADLQKLVEERDAARAEKSELLDKFQRAQAEFENTRKRLQREREETREYAAMETIEALLPVVDDLERALSAEGVDPEFRKGLDLIYNRIGDVFKRLGLQTIEVKGKFDPDLHQAVDRAPAESDDQDQRILEVYRPGYKFKDRLLRAAMVKVAVKE
jgi:molecular chaperone GrpE